jgi:hypothetical protein
MIVTYGVEVLQVRSSPEFSDCVRVGDSGLNLKCAE